MIGAMHAGRSCIFEILRGLGLIWNRTGACRLVRGVPSVCCNYPQPAAAFSAHVHIRRSILQRRRPGSAAHALARRVRASRREDLFPGVIKRTERRLCQAENVRNGWSRAEPLERRR